MFNVSAVKNLTLVHLQFIVLPDASLPPMEHRKATNIAPFLLSQDSLPPPPLGPVPACLTCLQLT